jgi:DNA/RNA endonuclease G (NUC1)
MPAAPTPRTTPTRSWVLVVLALVVLLIVGAVVVVLLVQLQGSPAAERTGATPTAAPPGTAASAPRQNQHPASTLVVRPPRSSRPLQVFDYGWFSVGYDNERRAGAWGRYELDGPITHTASQPRRPTFRTETRSTRQVTTKDYTNPGNVFERGHIVPSYAMWSRFGDEARTATFVMTNVFPQDGDLNGRVWEDIEDDIAGQAKGGVVTDEGYAGRLRHITVIAGPVYGSTSRYLPSGIPVPDACFQVIYDLEEQASRLRARAYLVENKPGVPGPPSRYAKTIREIESVTGLDFMPENGPAIDALELAPAVRGSW